MTQRFTFILFFFSILPAVYGQSATFLTYNIRYDTPSDSADAWPERRDFLAGQLRFGPDVQWLPATPFGAEDYSVPADLAPAFERSIRRYWPGLVAGSLQPAYAGLRPKLHAPQEAARDFVIHGPAVHGIEGLVNLMGIESPGLTACLAIAENAVDSLAG